MIGGAAGIALGVPVGYYFYQKVGSIVGAIIFGIVGSEVGEYVFETVEESLENMLIGHRKKQLSKKEALKKRSKTIRSKKFKATSPLLSTKQKNKSLRRVQTLCP